MGADPPVNALALQFQKSIKEKYQEKIIEDLSAEK